MWQELAIPTGHEEPPTNLEPEFFDEALMK